MQVVAHHLDGLKLITPRVHRDSRGFFLESFNALRYRELGVVCDFVQDNHSQSARGTLRGLHYQSTPGQAKLVRCVRGTIFDVAVDLRPNSPTFGRSAHVTLDDKMHQQFFVPAGFAHGFMVLSDVAEVLYKVSTPYHAPTEMQVAYNDPDLAVPFPQGELILSDRDKNAPSFADFCRAAGVARPEAMGPIHS